MRYINAILLIALVAFLASCAGTNPVASGARTHAEALLDAERCAITDPGTLSVHSLMVLRVLDLEDAWRKDPASALAPLAADRSGAVPPWQMAMAEAELRFQLAQTEPDAEAAQKAYLGSLTAALRGAREEINLGSFLDPRHRLLGEIYNRALARILALGQGLDGHPATWKGIGGVPVRVARGPGLVDPASYDQVIPAQEIRQTGIANEYRRYGIGAPLIAVRDNRKGETERKDPLRPPTITEPLTVVLRPAEDQGLELVFVDPIAHQTFVSRDGRVLPLSADFTAPLAWLVAHSPMYSKENPSLFDPASFAHVTGLYMAQPYDPDRIPVIMTHGLWSSPLTWIWLMNEVWGDPELRARYQVWFYAYPTGLPILVNAGTFRERIEAARRAVDPEGDDFATRHLVLVGHSMGGLLSKHMVKQAGNRIWDARFTRPFAEVKGDEADLALLRRGFFHEPLPYVDRVIFMATPHRGSSLAEGLVGFIGSSLISLPKDLEDAARRLLAQNPGLARKGPGLEDAPLTSIDGLRSDSPLTAALEASPWREGLPFHCVIGDETGAGKTGGTDGVVPYASSHLDGAVSELIVHSDHSVTGDPAAMAEVRRILHLHLGSVAGKP